MDGTDYAIPAHVPPERIFRFDLYGLNEEPALEPDVQAGLSALLRPAPDIFFTPCNGGHWVVKRYETMCRILQDPARFSARQLTVPKSAAQQKLIPLSLDPPEHTPYRQILMRFFAPKTIAAMEPFIRARAQELIAAVAPTGHCDFMEHVAAPLPVFVFMAMMGLPTEKFGAFRTIAVEWFGIPNGPRRGELAQIILGHLRETIAERRTAPRDDLISRLIAERVEGRPLDQEEIESISFLLFLAGLDTVTNGAGFLFHRLARMPEMQRQLVAEPDRIPAFIDEGLRTCGVVTTVRTLMAEVELDGVLLKTGDLVMVPLPLAGYDATLHSDPATFDPTRQRASHLMFSIGPHLCVGNGLARRELRLLVEEWLRAIPSFAPAPDYAREVRIGSIIGLMNLDLVWPVEAARRETPRT